MRRGIPGVLVVALSTTLAGVIDPCISNRNARVQDTPCLLVFSRLLFLLLMREAIIGKRHVTMEMEMRRCLLLRWR
jgi:hypothetical protein